MCIFPLFLDKYSSNNPAGDQVLNILRIGETEFLKHAIDFKKL